MKFRILFQDSHLVVVDKPAGIHVHPPEDQRERISKSSNGLAILRNQLNQYIYPVHRLDRATSGVLIYALSSEASRNLQLQFQNHEIQKNYLALARGTLTHSHTIDRPLQPSEPAITRIDPLWTGDLPFSIRKEFTHTRFSWILARPTTGRFHQIRRHLAFESHPLLGDSMHGDTKLNRAFREYTGMKTLTLKAYQIGFRHPFTHEWLSLQSKWGKDWLKLFDLFQFCPIIPKPQSPSVPK
jgi:tRNA pseudouridine65 synthase